MKFLPSTHVVDKHVAGLGPICRLWTGLLPALVIFVTMILPSPALADWNNTAENIQNHPTWIFTPSRTMATGKHVLFIVLHGCDQTHTQIRKFGNLESTANDNAMVVAVPGVGKNPRGPRCWNYHLAADQGGHIAELVPRLREFEGLAGRSFVSLENG